MTFSLSKTSDQGIIVMITEGEVEYIVPAAELDNFFDNREAYLR